MRHTASHLMEVRLCRQSLQLLESHSLDESPPQLQRMLGERVNIEIDPQTQAVVDTVERVLAARENAVRNQADIG